MAEDLRLRARDETRAAFASVQRNFDGLSNRVASFSRLFAGVGGVLSAGAFVGVIRSTVNFADELGKLSQKTGVAVEDLSALKYAADLSGVGLEQLQGGLRNLSRSIDTNSDAFKRLNLDPRQFKGTYDGLLQVADAVARLEDGAAKTAIVGQLLGERFGQELIPLLNQGSSGIRKLADEAQRAGIIISADMARAAEEFNDALTRLGAQAQGAGIRISKDLLPFLVEVTTQLNEGIRISGGFFEAIRTLGTINPFRSLAGNVRELTRELEALRDAQARPRGAGTSEQTFDEIQRRLQSQIQTTTRQIEFLKLQQQRQALASTGGARDLDPRDLRVEQERLAREARRRAPSAEEAKPKRGRDEFAGVLQQLERERQAIQQLTSEQRLLQDIESGRIKLTAQQREIVRGKIEEVAAIRGQREAEEERARVIEETQRETRTALAEEIAERKRQSEQIEQAAESYRRLIDPAREYKQELEEIDRLAREGALSPDEAGQAQRLTSARAAQAALDPDVERFRRLADPARDLRREIELLQEKAREGLIPADEAEKARQVLERQIRDVQSGLNDVGRQLGLTFSSAIEDAIVNLEDLGDVADAVFQDILRLAVRKSITEPLLGGLSGVFGGAGGGGGIGELLKVFGFAGGGIMTPHGPLQLANFASGGVATRRTLAQIREGDMNEAIIPLPDGRSVPVQMRGEGRGVSVTMNVYAQDAASFRRSRRQILGELRSQLEFA